MTDLQDILKDLDQPLYHRIDKALELMNRQAIGSQRFREGIKVWTKDDRTPVSVADLLHQSQVQQMIAENFPGDGLVCEEPHALQAEVIEEASAASHTYYDLPLLPKVIILPETGKAVWMLDPIDGTKGYLAGRHYAIALGLFVEGEPIFGAMAAPTGPKCLPLRINGTLAFAVKGQGAWMAKSEFDWPLRFDRLGVQEQDIKKPYRIAVSLEHSGELGQKLSQREDVKIVKLDSQAKYLAVAAGDLDAYIRESRKDGYPDVTWDHLPGAIIALEAGCSVHQFGGAPLKLLPQSRIDYGRGVICYRGRPDGPMADLVTQLTGS